MTMGTDCPRTLTCSIAKEISKLISYVIYVVYTGSNYSIMTKNDTLSSGGEIHSSYHNGNCTYDISDWK